MATTSGDKKRGVRGRMSQFEISGNKELAEMLQGVSPTSLRIARNALWVANMEHFIGTYVEPTELQDQGDRFGYGYVSAYADSGKLMHVRCRMGEIGQLAPSHRQFAVVTGSFHNTAAQMQTNTTVVHRSTYWGTKETDIILDAPDDGDERLLRVVDDTVDTQAEWRELEIQRLLDADAATQRREIVRLTPQGWLLKDSEGKLEPLHDLMRLQREVRIATERGLAGAAFIGEEIAKNPSVEIRQFGEKVVG